MKRRCCYRREKTRRLKLDSRPHSLKRHFDSALKVMARLISAAALTGRWLNTDRFITRDWEAAGVKDKDRKVRLEPSGKLSEPFRETTSGENMKLPQEAINIFTKCREVKTSHFTARSNVSAPIDSSKEICLFSVSILLPGRREFTRCGV